MKFNLLQILLVLSIFFQINNATGQDTIKKNEVTNNNESRRVISNSKIDVSKIKSSTNETIYLKLNIDSSGKIAEIKNLEKRTTTKNSELINEVIKNIQDNYIYSPSTNVEPYIVYLTVKIKAN